MQILLAGCLSSQASLLQGTRRHQALAVAVGCFSFYMHTANLKQTVCIANEENRFEARRMIDLFILQCSSKSPDFEVLCVLSPTELNS